MRGKIFGTLVMVVVAVVTMGEEEGKEGRGEFKITPMESKAQFQRVGEIWSEVSEMHVVFNLNFNELVNNINNTEALCGHMNMIIENTKKEDIQRMAEGTYWKCRREQESMERRLKVLDTLFKVEEGKTREKRFLGLITAGLALGAGSLITLELEHLVGGGDNGEKEMVKILQGHETVLTRENIAIRKINGTLLKLAKTVVYEEEMSRAEMLTESVILALGLEAEHFNLAYEALTKLIEGKLSTDLLPMGKLKSTIRGLNKELKKKNFRMAIRKWRSFYSLPLDFIVQEKRNVLLRITIPVAKIGSSMTLYKLLMAPIRKKSLNAQLVVDANELIAVNYEQSAYQILSSSHLDTCPVYDGKYFCKLNNVIHRQFRQNCISSLYKGEFSKFCEAFVIPDKNFAMMISKNVFLTYHVRPTSVMIKCGQQQTVKILQGFNNLFLSNCIASSEDYVLRGMYELVDLSAFTHIISINWTDIAVLETHDQLHVQDLLEDLHVNRVVPVRDIAAKVRVSETSVRDVAHLSVTTVLAGVIIIIVIVICVVWRRGRRELKLQEEVQLNKLSAGDHAT